MIASTLHFHAPLKQLVWLYIEGKEHEENDSLHLAWMFIFLLKKIPI